MTRPPSSSPDRRAAIERLDALVAEKVNGWILAPAPEGRGYRGVAWRDKEGLLACAQEELPAYSRDAELCLGLLEFMAPETHGVEIRRLLGGAWRVRVEDGNRREPDIVAGGETMAEAVCAAAIAFRERRPLEAARYVGDLRAEIRREITECRDTK